LGNWVITQLPNYLDAGAMDTQVLLIIGGVIVVIVLVLYWQRQGVVKRPSPFTTNDTSGILPDWGQNVGFTPQQVAQINAEIQADRKINAIKLYREFTGLGLKEAKDAVDAMMSGKMPTQVVVERPYNFGGGDMMDKIQRELQAGRKINAIKLYREMTGLGLKEAKDAIDAMEHGQMPSATSPQISGDVMGQVEQELRAGRKINAVKLYREAHGVGLKEAKDAVDAMERQLGLR
jgi:ribosomal protein L7/L12